MFRRWGTRLTSVATAALGLTSLLGSPSASTGVAPSLAIPFALAGAALVVAAALMWLEWRADLVELILGGLAAGTFGVALAEMSAQAATIDDHYKSLWIPMLLGSLLVSFLACRPPRPDRT